MLIICPSCATSYMIDQAAVGAGGRTVRCARCKATWFAGGTPPVAGAPAIAPTRTGPDVSAFVDGVIAEAEAKSSPARGKPQPANSLRDALAARNGGASDDDFGHDGDEDGGEDERPDATAARGAKAAMPRAEPFAAIAADATTQIADGPSLVPPIEHEPFPDPEAAPDEAAESYNARRERLRARRKKSRLTSRWTALALVLVAFNVAVVGARQEVVRYLPQTASLFAAIGLPVNLRDLRFDNVRIARETEDGVSILIVEGSIISDASGAVEVPRLRFAARDKAGQEVYTWTMLPERSILQPGEKLPFRSRLAAPPKDAQDVMVRFFTPRDVEAKAK